MSKEKEITNCGDCGKEYTLAPTVAGQLHDPSGPRYFCPDCVESELAATAESQELEDYRAGAGVTECEYCGGKDCDYSCDESQAGGFDVSEMQADADYQEALADAIAEAAEVYPNGRG
jgi:DNA-directed RNA polymerase subunit RPC12/RpoP